MPLMESSWSYRQLPESVPAMYLKGVQGLVVMRIGAAPSFNELLPTATNLRDQCGFFCDDMRRHTAPPCGTTASRTPVEYSGYIREHKGNEVRQSDSFFVGGADYCYLARSGCQRR